MSEENFKLPKSSYEELVKMIKAYGHFKEPVGLDEVSKTVGMNATLISANVGFLVATEILESGAKKQATPKGKELALALEHEMPDQIRSAWRNVIMSTEFLSRILTAIRIRKGMDDATLQAHIAYSAGQPKKPQFMTGARTVVDILRAAELVRDENGKIVAVAIVASDAPKVAGADSDVNDVVEYTPNSTPLADSCLVQTAPISVNNVGTAKSISIQIRIDCKPGELTGLGKQIRALIQEIELDAQLDGNADVQDQE